MGPRRRRSGHPHRVPAARAADDTDHHQAAAAVDDDVHDDDVDHHHEHDDDHHDAAGTGVEPVAGRDRHGRRSRRQLARHPLRRRCVLLAPPVGLDPVEPGAAAQQPVRPAPQPGPFVPPSARAGRGSRSPEPRLLPLRDASALVVRRHRRQAVPALRLPRATLRRDRNVQRRRHRRVARLGTVGVAGVAERDHAVDGSLRRRPLPRLRRPGHERGVDRRAPCDEPGGSCRGDHALRRAQRHPDRAALQRPPHRDPRVDRRLPRHHARGAALRSRPSAARRLRASASSTSRSAATSTRTKTTSRATTTS